MSIVFFLGHGPFHLVAIEMNPSCSRKLPSTSCVCAPACVRKDAIFSSILQDENDSGPVLWKIRGVVIGLDMQVLLGLAELDRWIGITPKKNRTSCIDRRDNCPSPSCPGRHPDTHKAAPREPQQLHLQLHRQLVGRGGLAHLGFGAGHSSGGLPARGFFPLRTRAWGPLPGWIPHQRLRKINRIPMAITRSYSSPTDDWCFRNVCRTNAVVFPKRVGRVSAVFPERVGRLVFHVGGVGSIGSASGDIG